MISLPDNSAAANAESIPPVRHCGGGQVWCKTIRKFAFADRRGVAQGLSIDVKPGIIVIANRNSEVPDILGIDVFWQSGDLVADTGMCIAIPEFSAADQIVNVVILARSN